AGDGRGRDGRNDAVRGPIAELAEVVVAPAALRPVLKDRARVLGARCDGGRRDAADRYRGRGIGGAPVPQPAFLSPSPALQRAVTEGGAHVEDAGFDGDGGGDGADGYRRWYGRDGLLGPRRIGSDDRCVAELAPGVGPPAANTAVLEERAGVPAAGCDGHGGGDAADACRRGVGGVNGGGHGPVAELTEVVLPPAEDGAIAGECAGDRKSTRLNSSHVSISYA